MASVAFLTGGAFFWSLAQDEDVKPTPTAVREHVFDLRKLEAPPWDGSRGPDLPAEAAETFDRGMRAYAQKNYVEASSWLHQAAVLAPRASEVHFFLGASYLMTRDVMAGIHELKTVLGLGASAYTDHARFHLAQALQARGDKASAREYLNAIPADSPMAAKAREFRSAMNLTVAR